MDKLFAPYLYIVHTFIPPKKGNPLNNEQNARPQLVQSFTTLYTVPTGGVSEHETLGNVECYDPETDRWVVDVIPQMRYRRSGVGVAVLQGLLFAIGGYLEGKTSTDAVECYNPRTKRYTHRPYICTLFVLSAK